MEITNEVKQRIVAAIAADRENYPSDNRHATALGIAPSVYNAIKRAYGKSRKCRYGTYILLSGRTQTD